MSVNADYQHIKAVFLAAGADPDKLAAWLHVNVGEQRQPESPRRG